MACEPICCRDTRPKSNTPGKIFVFKTCDDSGTVTPYYVNPCLSIGPQVRCPSSPPSPPSSPSPTGCTYKWMCLDTWGSMRRRPGKVADKYCKGPRPSGCEGDQTICTVECKAQGGYRGPRASPPARTLPQFPQQVARRASAVRGVAQSQIGRTLPFQFYVPRTYLG